MLEESSNHARRILNLALELGFLNPAEVDEIERRFEAEPGSSYLELLADVIGIEKLEIVTMKATFADAEDGWGDDGTRTVDARGPRDRPTSGDTGDSSAEKGYRTRPSVNPSVSGIAATPECPDRYSFRGELGRGAIGRVFAAQDGHIGRDVAVKELLSGSLPLVNNRSSATVSSRVVRFLREARITAQLQHPSIVPVYEIGLKKSGSFYYTMKLVRGRTLLDAINGAQTLDDRLKLLPHFRDICHAIAFAHSKDVIHRDIKPSNVMIGEFGETVVLDWGIAKVRGEDDDALRLLRSEDDQDAHGTVDGSALGTPAYMAPEQAAGKITEVDELSDVYALGAVLYQILTGSPPYQGRGGAEIMSKVLVEPIPPIPQGPGAPPSELVAVAHKALAREKNERFQGAGQIASEIEAFMSGERVEVYDYSSLELLQRFTKKNKTLIAAAGVVLLVGIFALVFVSLSYRAERQSNEKMVEAVAHEQLALRREKEARAKEQASERLAHFHMAQGLDREAGLRQADRQFMSAAIDAAASLLNNPASPQGPHFTERFSERYPDALQLRAAAASKIFLAELRPSADLAHILEAADAVYAVAYSRDGHVIASGGADKKIYLWDAQTGRLLRHLEGHEGTVAALSFAPGKDLLASGGLDGSVRVWRVSTGELVHTIKGAQERVWAVAYSPDGKTLAAGSGEGRSVQLWKTSTMTLAGRLEGHTDVVTGVAFSPDGQALASTGADRTVHVWDLECLCPKRVMKSPDRLWALSWSPDGQSIAAGGFDNRAYVWDPASGQRVSSLEGHGDRIYSVAYSPDGQTLATGSVDRTIRIWDASSGQLLLNVGAHEGIVMALAYSPDGRTLVSGSYDKTIKVRRLRLRSDIVTLEGHDDRISYAAYAPSGERIATAGLDKTVRIWDASTGDELEVLRGHSDIVYSVAFSPDEKRLVSTSADKTVRVWSLGGEHASRQLEGHEDVVACVAISPDGETAVTGGEDSTVLGWDLETGRQLFAIDAHEAAIWAVAYSPDGKKIATGSYDKTIRLWDAQTQEQLRLIESADWVSGVAFSPDGRTLYSSGKDAVATAWDVETKKMLRRFEGHSQWVNYPKVSFDGKLLATSSDDRTVRLWSTRTGEPLIVLDTREGLALDFAPGGDAIVIGDKERAHIYPLARLGTEPAPKNLLRDMERRAGKRLRGFLFEHLTADEFKKIK